MAMGKTCPMCGQRTFHDRGSHHECRGCHFVGWGWNQPVTGMGSGKGMKCPNCGKHMLHTITWLDDQQYVLRCSCCDYAGVGRQQP